MANQIQAQKAEVVIPPQSNRREPRAYDEHQYKDRNLVERCISHLKQFRRVATRYDKCDTYFQSIHSLRLYPAMASNC